MSTTIYACLYIFIHVFVFSVQIGSSLDTLRAKDESIAYTLWGELAYQLGGNAGYALVQESDRKKLFLDWPIWVPGWKSPHADHAGWNCPSLAAKAGGVIRVRTDNVGTPSRGILKSLLEFAANKERCPAVLTLAGETDAFAKETAFLVLLPGIS